jgi:hypothetical protein
MPKVRQLISLEPEDRERLLAAAKREGVSQTVMARIFILRSLREYDILREYDARVGGDPS